MKKFALLLVLFLTGCGGFFPKQLTSITLNPATLTLTLGQTQQFIATGFYSDGTNKDLTQTAKWSSSESGLIGISLTGQIFADRVGTSTITATEDTVSSTATVSVVLP